MLLRLKDISRRRLKPTIKNWREKGRQKGAEYNRQTSSCQTAENDALSPRESAKAERDKQEPVSSFIRRKSKAAWRLWRCHDGAVDTTRLSLSPRVRPNRLNVLSVRKTVREGKAGQKRTARGTVSQESAILDWVIGPPANVPSFQLHDTVSQCVLLHQQNNYSSLLWTSLVKQHQKWNTQLNTHKVDRYGKVMIAPERRIYSEIWTKCHSKTWIWPII